MSSVVINRETALKNLKILATAPNIDTLQPGADGNTLEIKTSWGHREVSFEQKENETQQKVQKIISATLECAEHFQNTNEKLTDSEASILSRVLIKLRESLPSYATATPEKMERKNLLLSIFHKSAMAGAKDNVVLSEALLTCAELLNNQALTPAIEQTAHQLIEVGLNNNNRYHALYVLKKLVINGQSYEKAAKAACTGIASSDDNEKRLSLEIFTELVKKGQNFDQATTAARFRGLSHKNPSVRYANIDLIVALVEKGQGLQEARLAISEAAKDQKDFIRWKSLTLFKALFTMDQVLPIQRFDSTILKTLEGLHPGTDCCHNFHSEPDILDLYKILVEKGIAYETAIEFVKQAARRYSDLDWWQSNTILRHRLVVSTLGLLETLVRKGKAYDLAIPAAEYFLKTNTPAHIDAALSLFKALFNQGQALEEGARISKTNAEANHWFQGYWDTAAFDEALESAQATQEKGQLVT